MRTALARILALASVPSALALVACGGEPLPAGPPPAPPPVAVAPAPAAPPPKLDQLARADFNRLAATLDLPLFWVADANGDRAVDAAEVAVLWGIDPKPGPAWIERGAFTERFFDAYRAMVARRGAPPPADPRRAAVLLELEQGRPTLVDARFTPTSPADAALVHHVLAAAAIIERLYARQKGSFGLDAAIPADDPTSRMVFYRNQGPWCEQPKTDKDPSCNASPAKPPKLAGLYPASLQKDPSFCAALEKRPDEKALMDPFVLVGEQGGGLAAVPFNAAYRDEMAAVSRELAAAAAAMTSDEAALKAYLTADAQAFLTNDWRPADEAWSKMTSENSKWYLRVAPDEVYADPCSRKAGFQVSFARIDAGSVAWKKLLDPLKNEMEGALAKLAGPPYKARPVTFHLPDFIDIVLNAGDARSATGATVGESLPNWGPVSSEGRGRTVAMVNIGTDPDSKESLREVVSSLFCPSTMQLLSLDEEASLTDTVLHEAAHNLGPANEYKVRGKTIDDLFGGELSSMYEEMKAEVSASYFADWLAQKKLLTPEQATKAHVRQVAWAFGHIADGVYTAQGKFKPYSQLAAVQMGTLVKKGVLVFHDGDVAANGSDKGCFSLDLTKYAKATAALEEQVLKLKARGEKGPAEALRADIVDKDAAFKRLREVIETRWRRLPKSSFVYKAAP